jgi:hypothetical protein
MIVAVLVARPPPKQASQGRVKRFAHFGVIKGTRRVATGHNGEDGRS